MAKEPYFNYLNEDISRTEEKIEKNETALSLEVRLAEFKESEERRLARTEERKRRFAQVEKRDQKSFRIYRLTLDDLAEEELPLVDPSDDGDDYIRRAVDEEAELEEGLEWPSGVDPVKREGLAVLRDLIDAIREESEIEEVEEIVETVE